MLANFVGVQGSSCEALGHGMFCFETRFACVGDSSMVSKGGAHGNHAFVGGGGGKMHELDGVEWFDAYVR